MDRFQVTSRGTEFWIDAGKSATVTNIGSSTVYGSPDSPPTSTATAAWSLAPGASRVEDVGAVWVLTATGASSTLTVDPIASGLAVDTGTGVPSLVGSGSGGSVAASSVTVTPTGTIAATDAQAALAEVASEAAQKSANLSDLANAGTARTNLGLGTAATQASTAFDAAGAAAAVLGMPLGLTGATQATRYVGATASGAPASGTFAIGDFIIDRTGAVYICTVAGSPGTWVTPSTTVRGLPGAFPESGSFFQPPLVTGNGTTGSEGVMTALPFLLGVSRTLTQLDAKVATAGGASSVLRLGLYADSGMYPGALIYDSGDITAAASAVKSATGVGASLTAGTVYWMACVVRGVGGAVPVMSRVITAGNTFSSLFGDPTANSGFWFSNAQPINIAFSQSSVTGALPSTFTSTRTPIANAIQIVGKVS